MKKRDAEFLADYAQQHVRAAGLAALVDVVAVRTNRSSWTWAIELRVHRPGARGEWVVHQTITTKRVAQEFVVFAQAILWAIKEKAA